MATLVGEKGYTYREQTWARPTCDVNGIFGGYQGKGAKTVLPSWAGAKVSMRLVPDQRPEKIAELFTAVRQARSRPGRQSRGRVPARRRAGAARSHGPAGRCRAGGDARDVWGRRPVRIREGGSIPIVATFSRVLKVPVLLLGFGLDDDRLHSPNEKFNISALLQRHPGGGAVARPRGRLSRATMPKAASRPLRRARAQVPHRGTRRGARAPARARSRAPGPGALRGQLDPRSRGRARGPRLSPAPARRRPRRAHHLQGAAHDRGPHQGARRARNAVGELDRAQALFESLGYRVVRRYQKMREEWRLGGVEVALDHTPIGDFVEFEGDRAEVLAKRCGFDPAKAEQRSYLRLYEDYRREHPEAPRGHDVPRRGQRRSVSSRRGFSDQAASRPRRSRGSARSCSPPGAASGCGRSPIRFPSRCCRSPACRWRRTPSSACARAGCEAVALNLHHLGERDPRRVSATRFARHAAASTRRRPSSWARSARCTPLRDFLRDADAVLLVNGDSLCRWPLEALVRRHLRSDAAATLLLVRRAPRRRAAAAASRSTATAGWSAFAAARRRPAATRSARRRVFAGAHVLAPALLERGARGSGRHRRRALPAAARRGGRISRCSPARRWHDLGTPRRYLDAALDAGVGLGTRPLARRRRRGGRGRRAAARTRSSSRARASAAGPGSSAAWCCPAAPVGAGCRLSETIVGFGAALPPGTAVERRLITPRGPAPPSPDDTVVGSLVFTPIDG